MMSHFADEERKPEVGGRGLHSALLGLQIALDSLSRGTQPFGIAKWAYWTAVIAGMHVASTSFFLCLLCVLRLSGARVLSWMPDKGASVDESSGPLDRCVHEQ